MHTEDVLTAVEAGVWWWTRHSRTITLDATAAGLLDLEQAPVSAGTVTVAEDDVRARVNVVDFVEFESIVALALAESALAEALLRVVRDDGTVVRTVRARMRPVRKDDVPDDEVEALSVVGVLSEIPQPPSDEQAGPPERGQTSVTGDWRRSREAFLLDAGRALAEARSTAEVLRIAATLSMPGFSPEGLAVFGVEGDTITVIGHHGQSAGAVTRLMDMPLETDYPAAEVVRTGRAIYLHSQEEYRSRFPTTWPLVEQMGRHSWAFLPLVAGGRTVGAWVAGFRHPVSFTPDERSVLTTVARMLGQALSRTSVHESERELANVLQEGMRPTHFSELEGMRIAARYVPTGGGLQVGGDWYDMISLPSGRTAMVIGDVQGHDVKAAGYMAQLRVALRAYATEGHHPDAVLSRASRFLHGLNEAARDPDERFATCLYVELDPVGGTLDMARAGPPHPAIRMPDGTLLPRPTAGGLPLGIDPDSDYPTTRLVELPGETLLMCTDGLIETGGHDLETGWARIRDLFSGGPADLERLADTLVQAVSGPSSHHRTGPLADRRDDDIALLLLRREMGLLERAVPLRRTLLTIAQAEPDRIAEARHQLRNLLHDWQDEDQVDGAVLMLSELLTNVLVHTEADALLVAEIAGEVGERRLHVEVADSSDELPHRRQPGELASSGRGLMLLESLAGAWGVDPRGGGKCIWFEILESGKTPGL
jgi:serine phosphatase RsbU (regulator of sigma subunit)/anti-sigma regulatory factor (Ser/Thr protein kinase)